MARPQPITSPLAQEAAGGNKTQFRAGEAAEERDETWWGDQPHLSYSNALPLPDL